MHEGLLAGECDVVSIPTYNVALLLPRARLRSCVQDGGVQVQALSLTGQSHAVQLHVRKTECKGHHTPHVYGKSSTSSQTVSKNGYKYRDAVGERAE